MEHLNRTKKCLTEQYIKIVQGCDSHRENEDKNFGFNSISGYDKDEYETRTFSNLNNVKF